MTDPDLALLNAFDGHSVADVRAALDAGADASKPINGKLATDWLLEQYTRSERLQDCLTLIIERGATFIDPKIMHVVMDDADGIRNAAKSDPAFLQHRTTLRAAFCSLDDASLLHVAAEYGNLNAARALIEMGADVNARAGVAADGVGGHTPLFHTVNSNANRSAPIMRLLVESGADCEVLIPALSWGKGYSWETTFFDVTPISFAQAGLMPQVHRSEQDIYENIKFLLTAADRKIPLLANIPNKYLQDGH